MNSRIVLLLLLLLIAALSLHADVPYAMVNPPPTGVLSGNAGSGLSFDPSPDVTIEHSVTGIAEAGTGSMEEPQRGSKGGSHGSSLARSNFSSGWIPTHFGNMIIKHKLGGNPDDYFVCVDSKDSTGQIHDVDGLYMMGDNWVGMMWYGLTDSSITISLAGSSPAALYKSVRVRIWLVK